jgi:hypothetical protein
MKSVALFAGLVVAIFLSFPVQEWIPPIPFFHGARILFFPALFACGALMLPYPATLLLAITTGLLTDAAYLHVVGGQVEIAAGWSIVFFVIFGSVAHGFEPSVRKGWWWLVIPLAGVGTASLLALQFVMIALRREGFVFSEVAAGRILGAGLAAAALAPLFHFAIRAAGAAPRSASRPILST